MFAEQIYFWWVVKGAKVNLTFVPTTEFVQSFPVATTLTNPTDESHVICMTDPYMVNKI